MSWFWMNIPLAAAFFAAWVGIPLWMVAKHPDRGPDAAVSLGSPELEAVLVLVEGDAAKAA
jgi:hypothetical protein